MGASSISCISRSSSSSQRPRRLQRPKVSPRNRHRNPGSLTNCVLPNRGGCVDGCFFFYVTAARKREETTVLTTNSSPLFPMARVVQSPDLPSTTALRAPDTTRRWRHPNAVASGDGGTNTRGCVTTLANSLKQNTGMLHGARPTARRSIWLFASACCGVSSRCA